jgi:stalled ribosome rescue protein Dom34
MIQLWADSAERKLCGSKMRIMASPQLPHPQQKYHIARSFGARRPLGRASREPRRYFGMRVLKRAVEPDGTGFVRLIADDEEDLWHMYNLVNVGDRVKATTLRKVVKESSTGSTTANKVRMHLTLEIDKIDFDQDTCALRCSGRNVEMHENVKLGAHHTLELEQKRTFTLIKEHWDSIALERLAAAAEAGRDAELAVLLLQPGMANLCLVSGHLTLWRARVDLPIPRKRAAAAAHDAGLGAFYGLVAQARRRHFNLATTAAPSSTLRRGFIGSAPIGVAGARAAGDRGARRL